MLNAAGWHVINIHGGHLPDYRGNHCFFFALFDGRRDKTNSTIHFVDAGVDTGDVIEHVTSDAQPGEAAEILAYRRAEKRAVHRLVELLRSLEEGCSLPRTRQPPGTHHSRETANPITT